MNKEIKCQHCGSINEEGVDFCSKCNGELKFNNAVSSLNEVSKPQHKKQKFYTFTSYAGWAKANFVVAFLSVIMGFYKMLFYKNSEYDFEAKTNAYVGGDAYNYIINGTYTSAFFILALVFIVVGIGFILVSKENEKIAILKEIDNK